MNTINNYAGFWRRFSANLIDFVILSYLFIILTSDFANGIYRILFSSAEIDGYYLIQDFAHSHEALMRILGFGIYTDVYSLENYAIIYPLLYRFSFFILFPFFRLFIWCYCSGLESSPLQATIGKLAVGLYVTDTTGVRISFGRATVRHFSKIISRIIILIGYFLAGWTSKKQALHDMISGCLVLTRKIL